MSVSLRPPNRNFIARATITRRSFDDNSGSPRWKACSPAPGAPTGDDYRDLAQKIREAARQTRLPFARRELLRLATNYERRGDHLDRRTCCLCSATRRRLDPPEGGDAGGRRMAGVVLVDLGGCRACSHPLVLVRLGDRPSRTPPRSWAAGSTPTSPRVAVLRLR